MKFHWPRHWRYCGSERPESAILSGLVLGGLIGLGEFPWTAIFPFAAVLLVLFRREARWYALAALSLQMLFAAWVGHSVERQYPASVPPGECALTAEFRVTDHRLSASPKFDCPRLVLGELRDCRSPDGSWQLAGPIPSAVYWPKDGSRPVYGGIYRLQGRLSSAYAPSDGFGAYLRSQQISRLVFPEQLTWERTIDNWRRRLFDWRDAAAEFCLGNFRNADLRNQGAALFFGMSGGMSHARRTAFIATGTVHIFSVSGAHVAIVAGLLLLITRPLPRFSRCLFLLIGSGIYVLMTGASPPAVRAYGMLALYAILQYRLYYLSPFAVFCWVGSVLLAAFPLLTLSVGARYSLAITGLLVAALDEREILTAESKIRSQLYRSGGRMLQPSVWERRFRQGLSAVFFCTVAFIGSAGFSLYHQNRLLPGSILVNLGLLALLPLNYLLLALRLLLPFDFTGFLLERGFALLNFWCGSASEILGDLPARTPEKWELLLYYAGAFALFRGHGIVRKIGMALLIVLPMAWISCAYHHPVELAVWSSSENQPPIITVTGERGVAELLVNPGPGNAATADAVLSFWHRRGVNQLELLTGTTPALSAWRWAAHLKDILPVRRLQLPPEGFSGRFWRTKRYFEATYPWAERWSAALVEPGKVKIIGQKSGFRLEYFDRGSKLNFILTIRDSEVGRQLVLRIPGTEDKSFLLPWNRNWSHWSHEFER